jgi:4-amino-4-deoxy-L-arabinose transferase-like glycosyltransferase
MLMVLGAAVRLAALGQVPAGLNSDEASTGVEALSLLRTGMDRWGNAWPVWFPAWGSGMNPLYTYLAVPVVWAFGLNVFNLRLIAALLGVAALPVTFWTARLYFGRGVALVALGLLALLPWHMMSTRWAQDSNMAPLWFTLGLFTTGMALRDGKKWPLLAFVPWAIAVYVYPVTIPPAVVSGVAILVVFRRRVRRQVGWWIAAILIAVLIDLPFLMFLAKNQLPLAHFPAEAALPFSVPVMPATRLGQIRPPFVEMLYQNILFMVSGYRTGSTWEQSAAFLPLTPIAPILLVFSAFALFRVCREAAFANLPTVLLIAMASAILSVFTIPLQLTRLNWFYIPSLIVGAWFVVELAKRYRPAPYLAGAYVAIFLMLFYPYYFIRFNDELTQLDTGLGNGYRIGLEDALRAEVAAALPGEPVFVDIGTVHPYLYVLFYGLGDIEGFQATRNVRLENGVYRVASFDRYYFEQGALPANRSFVFVSRTNALPCQAPTVLRTDPLWAVGRCPG